MKISINVTLTIRQNWITVKKKKEAAAAARFAYSVAIFIHSFNKYQQCSFYMPRAILNVGNMKLMKETQTLNAGTWGNHAGVNRTTELVVTLKWPLTPPPKHAGVSGTNSSSSLLPSFGHNKAGPQAQSLGFSAVTRIMFWLLDRMKDEKEGGFPENSRVRAEKGGKRERRGKRGRMGGRGERSREG